MNKDSSLGSGSRRTTIPRSPSGEKKKNPIYAEVRALRGAENAEGL